MNKNADLIFYNFGSKKIDFTTARKIFNKPIALSKGFNKALKSVMEKDINFLSKKVQKIINEINLWIKCNISDYNEIKGDINEMDNVIESIKELKTHINNKKKNTKIGMFTLKKKEKKMATKNLGLFLNKVDTYLISLEAIKIEYNKLMNKKNSIKEDSIENVLEEDSDPLERTISFYLSQNK